MNIDFQSLLPDLEALTPDGRWNALQDWLTKNPEYGERVERWSDQPVDSVYFEISAMIVNRYGPLATIALGVPTIKAKLTSAIELLQACYRERQAYDNQPLEKEINNVRPHKRLGRKNPKRV